MARETTPAKTADRLANLTALFGEEAETFFLTEAGDYVIGTVESTGEMTTVHGVAPYVDFVLESGESAETEDVTPGKRYRLAFLGTVMAGRFNPSTFVPGARFAALNRGVKSNRAKTQEYRNVEVRILPAE